MNKSIVDSIDKANGRYYTIRQVEIEQKKADVIMARNWLTEQLETEKQTADIESQEPTSFKQVEIQQCEEWLNALARDKGQEQGAYKPNISCLLNSIQQDNTFFQKSVRLLDNHVQLFKPLWSSILEKTFSGALEAFIFTGKQVQSSSPI